MAIAVKIAMIARATMISVRVNPPARPLEAGRDIHVLAGAITSAGSANAHPSRRAKDHIRPYASGVTQPDCSPAAGAGCASRSKPQGDRAADIDAGRQGFGYVLGRAGPETLDRVTAGHL